MLFVGCDLLNAAPRRQAATAGNRRRIMVGGKKSLTVDVHCHCYVDVSDLVKEHQASLSATPAKKPPTTPFLDPTDVTGRLRHMDEHGIDVQAVCIAPNYNAWADRELASRIAQRQNEQIARMCSTHPDRFVGLASVSLQHPDLAAEQLEHAIKSLEMRGAEIDANVKDVPLSDPKFDPFWAKAEELEAFIFIHPESVVGAKPRFPGNGFLDNVIGHPLETTVALSHLIFEGTLDRYPGLKICGAHGGGYLGSYLGRSDHCAEFGDPCKHIEKKLPSEYFKQQLYCDSIVFTSEGLRHLVANVGASHVLLGTDFPFDAGFPHMGESGEADFILGAGLSDADQLAILGGNAAKLLRINS